MKGEPSIRTHKDDARIELSNLSVLLVMVAVVAGSFLLTLSMSLTLAITFLLTAGLIDIVLTADGINRGYKEANLYRVLLTHLGDKKGLDAMIALNFSLRGAVIILLSGNPVLILWIAFFSLLAPLWNALTMMSFRDDIVLTVSTSVPAGNTSLTLSTGEKKRLETIKDSEEENYGD